MIDLDAYVFNLRQQNGNRPVAVFGLGLTGLSVIKALRQKNVEVLAWDDNADSHEEAQRAGAILTLLNHDILSDCAALIPAPGIPLTHPIINAAREAGIEIYGDIEILARANIGRPIIGITGTNGKSTVTALVTHILKVCGKDAQMGGNIGMPVLSLNKPQAGGMFVLELSSFQLDLCPTFRPNISVLMNITPDHIDRHGTIENYIAAKEKIFDGHGIAVIGIDDEHTNAMYTRLKANGHREAIPISGEKQVSQGVYVKDGHLYGRKTEVGSLNGITTLLGVHNHQNAAAAYAVCRACGLEPAEIYEAMKTYPGLPHRQYPVRAINGVSYINDSKATNAEAAAKALACHKNIYWILGGRAKEGGLNGLERYMDKIRHAFVIGEAQEQFAEWLKKFQVPHQISFSLDNALADAHKLAQSERGQPGGSTVLLSPACSSYDQFKNFEERGNHFTTLVESLEDAA